MSRTPRSAYSPLGDRNEHYWRVREMARAAAVSPSAAARAGVLSQDRWAEMIETCRACPDPEGCARWMAGHDVEGSAPDLCPQKGVFSALRTALDDASD